MADHYQTLGVSADADHATIKRAYRARARALHPDQNPDDAEADGLFHALSEAYAVLGDPERRGAYDAALRDGAHASSPPASAAASAGTVGGSAPAIRESVGATLGRALGTSWRFVRGKRGRDVTHELAMDLEDVASGLACVIDAPSLAACACGGSDADCAMCGGHGESAVLEPLEVTVPAGVVDGQRLRLRGRGLPLGEGDARGDLTVVIKVRRHPVLRRDGRDVHCVLPLRFAEVACGARVPLPTVDGLVHIDIPAGTPHGKVLRLAERGLPAVDSKGRGDQIVTIEIEVPSTLTRRQRQLITEAAQAASPDDEPRRTAYLAVIAELYEP